MDLASYIQHLQAILESEGNIELLFMSTDDEGNSYRKVHYEPEVAYVYLEESKEYMIGHVYDLEEILEEDEPISDYIKVVKL